VVTEDVTNYREEGNQVGDESEGYKDEPDEVPEVREIHRA
jgi:hypothetical protein